ncbi:hypothetical protein Aeqsu_1945 [Aequorivita sublithincola DSM 14238]|uniref:Addiction module component n=1 Tax=Aequorivita sublithincola (strain DSM 14238 / LMG 21431 / ACAM 643 / 9-3) TaxID=746697 RepID=I3YWQ0_AEQSU|nr:hypothetical protein [Aequorivita sublithincola]AFL81418.1 hypothetical protein Aeqsu_1945 [Aequorivita sublithincola DSM 14238]
MIVKINTTEDTEILENVMRHLDVYANEEIYVLNEAQITAIEEAREDYRNGRFLTNEEANAEIEKWLKE